MKSSVSLSPKAIETLKARIRKTSENAVCRELGMTPTTVDKAVSGGPLYRDTKIRLEAILLSPEGTTPVIAEPRSNLSYAERRWHWRTWNLLLQIQEATDGQDRRQLSGEMTTRGLCIPLRSEVKALHVRGWIRDFDVGELFDWNTGDSKTHLVWEVTDLGRQALDAARAEGITIR